MRTVDISQYLEIFLEESKENIQVLNDCLLSLEEEPDDLENVNTIFRLMHNIKGMSATMGFTFISDFTHKVENVLSGFRDGSTSVTLNVINVLFESLDVLQYMFTSLENGEEFTDDISKILEKLEAILLMSKEEKVEEVKKSAVENVSKNTAENMTKKVKKLKNVNHSIKVDLKTLDFLAEMISDLMINSNRLQKYVDKDTPQEEKEVIDAIKKSIYDIQEMVGNIRMLPLDKVVSIFPRMMRDLANELNKDINFIIEGKDLLLDRTVLDEISDPLVHILRNAVDHGIENKEEREKTSKNSKAEVKLKAYNKGNQAIIEISDDGKGLDVERIKSKAESKGIDTSKMDDSEIKSLIFHSGFTTKEAATDISGRGVGMDVVKTKIHSIGGKIVLNSKLGYGTKFEIKIPLTLQIIKALLIVVENQRFAISLAFIEDVLIFNSEYVKKNDENNLIIEYNESVIEIIDLRKKLFDLNKNLENGFIIILKVGQDEVAIFVDSILGQREIVTKSISQLFNNMKIYAGATILSDGEVTLILDVPQLVTEH